MRCSPARRPRRTRNNQNPVPSPRPAAMPTIGYFPYGSTPGSAEAGWLGEHLRVSVRVADPAATLNAGSAAPLPRLESLAGVIGPFLGLPAVVAEGPGGFLWASLLRAHGFSGTVTVLPYLNPRRWQDVAATCVYRRFAAPGDRIFLGSSPSAAVYRGLGVDAGTIASRPAASPRAALIRPFHLPRRPAFPSPWPLAANNRRPRHLGARRRSARFTLSRPSPDAMANDCSC